RDSRCGVLVNGDSQIVNERFNSPITGHYSLSPRFDDGVTLPGAVLPGFCALRSRTIQKFDKTSSGVAEDQRVVILSGLVANQPRIGAARRSELVLSSIRDAGGQAEEESLNGNDVN